MKVKGTYTSVWEDGELTSDARIDLDTHKVDILQTYDPSDEDMECECLLDQYVTINGKDYPCCQEDDYDPDEGGYYYE